MNTIHNCLKIDISPTDWKFGDGHIKLGTNTLGTWLPYIEYYERQLLNFGDTDGCVLFTAQEAFDAQIEQQMALGLIPEATIELFNQLGYMDSVNSLDGKAHFHSSPRFLQILTGNGLNGNDVTDAFDVMRNYGVLPYLDLPVDLTLTPEQYIDPTAITIAMKNKAAQLLAAIGGKSAVQYQWVCDGTENWVSMVNAIPNAPLCLGVNVGPNWNNAAPTAPAVDAVPGHCVMGFTIVEPNDMRIYDHYIPNPKDLISYPINYASQLIVTVTPPPIVQPVPTVQPTQANVNILKKIVALYQAILSLLNPKVVTESSNTMTKSFWQGILWDVVHVAVFGLSFGVPYFILHDPAVASMSLGTLLTLISQRFQALASQLPQ